MQLVAILLSGQLFLCSPFNVTEDLCAWFSSWLVLNSSQNHLPLEGLPHLCKQPRLRAEWPSEWSTGSLCVMRLKGTTNIFSELKHITSSHLPPSFAVQLTEQNHICSSSKINTLFNFDYAFSFLPFFLPLNLLPSPPMAH